MQCVRYYMRDDTMKLVDNANNERFFSLCRLPKFIESINLQPKRSFNCTCDTLTSSIIHTLAQSHTHTHKHIANNNPNYTHTIIHQPSCSIIEWFVYLYTSNKSLYHSYHTLDVDCGRFDLNAPRRGQSRIEHVWQWSTTTKQHTNFQIKYSKSSSYI